MYRKLLFSTLLLSLMAVYSADAQIKLKSELDYTTYLQYEPIAINVTIESELGIPTVFNAEEDDPRFYFLVTDESGIVISSRKDVAQPHPVMIPPRSTEILKCNLLKYFPVQKPGYYSVQPCVDWRDKSYRGEKKHIEVVSGREVSRATGVVPADNSVRLYRLYHINRKHQDHLLLRIDDEAAHLCYGVFSLGRTIISSPPEIAIDAEGQAHVIVRVSPRSHIYAIYSPMGHLVSSEAFGQQYSDVELVSNQDGSIRPNAAYDSQRGGEIPFVESIIEKNKKKRAKRREIE